MSKLFNVLYIFVVLTPLYATESREISSKANSSDDGTITFSGKAEMEFVDVEGEGGFENKGGADRTLINNKSPHFSIDKLLLNPHIKYNEHLRFDSKLRFEPNKFSIQNAVFSLNIRPYRSIFSFGLDDSIVKINRKTESYPLIGLSYWRKREYHLVYKGVYGLQDLKLSWSASLAQKRPISTDEVGEDKGMVKIISYGENKLIEGINFTYGGLLSLEFFGAGISLFGFSGKLASRDDMNSLSSEISDYDSLENRFSDIFHWSGGRVTYSDHDIHLIGEYIRSREGELKRSGYYIQGSYRISLFDQDSVPFSKIEPVVRYGQLNINNLESTPSDPESWDHAALTLALISNLYKDLIILKSEYHILDEKTGGDNVPNNELVLQMLFQF